MNRFRLRCLMHYEEATQVFGISVDPNSGVAAAMEVPKRHLTSKQRLVPRRLCHGGLGRRAAALHEGPRVFSPGRASQRRRPCDGEKHRD